MPPFIDLTGNRFGRLTVIRREGTTDYGQPRWSCTCDCGKQTAVFGNSLRSGATQSCGCLHRENITTHGKTKTPEFDVWQMMRQRCNNSKHHSYPRYGGRGILVCERWNQSFSAFLKDMGPRPSPTHTLDRINNDLGYTPKNCRWATPRQQGANKTSARPITFGGETLTMNGWCERLGISLKTLHRRLNSGRAIRDVLVPSTRKKATRLK